MLFYKRLLRVILSNIRTIYLITQIYFSF